MRIRWLLSLLSVLILARIVYSVVAWGRPVPFQFRVAERADLNGDGLPDTWKVSVAPEGKIGVVEEDTNFDGRIDRLKFTHPQTKTVEISSAGQRRKLAICLDGVPYEDIVALWDEGHFREFSRPGKLISVFPSLSDLALTEVLHTAKVPGYENLYFDVQQNRIAGGAASTLSKARIPYLEALDYDEPGIFKGLAYVLPVKTYHADLGRFLKRYSASDLQLYRSHICSTDAICHVVSQEEFRRYLLEADHLLRQIFIQHQGQLDLLVFSDHGSSHVKSKRVDLEGFLSRHGFELGSSIKSERTVVAPGFGLVGAIVLYCQPPQARALAELLTRMEGVDLAIYLDGEAVQVVSPAGSARIRTADWPRRLKYEVLTGDPLRLNSLLQEMTRHRTSDAEGYATSETWFEATAEHEYPDAINALYASATNHVKNRANVLLSLKDEYHYGSRLFGKLVTLHSAHGSLRRSSMTGFFMRNGPMRQRILPSRKLLTDF
jgi:Type I phosphodiesterase / nucleotide pyrophosphatase